MSEIQAPLLRPFAAISGMDMQQVSRDGFKCIALSSGVAELIVNLTERYQFEDLADVAPLPATYGFLDMSECEILDAYGHKIRLAFSIERHGGLMAPERMPLVCCFVKRPDQPLSACGVFAYDLGPEFPDKLLTHQLSIMPQFSGPIGKEDLAAYLASLATFFVAACAVLAAPGVRSVEEKRKVRWARQRQIGCPLLDYRVVDIDIDALAGVPEKGGSLQVVGSQKALHHVRGHLRLTDKGLVPVRPHWRGNPAFGTKLRDYNIKRSEEMN